ncbi:hypothetical protein ETD85_55685, partial [Nonomuraea zeae]
PPPPTAPAPPASSTRPRPAAPPRLRSAAPPRPHQVAGRAGLSRRPTTALQVARRVGPCRRARSGWPSPTIRRSCGWGCGRCWSGSGAWSASARRPTAWRRWR